MSIRYNCVQEREIFIPLQAEMNSILWISCIGNFSSRS